MASGPPIYKYGLILTPPPLMWKERGESRMLQKNHHFLFPQTYFGSHDQMESDLFDEDQSDVIEPWILMLENDPTNQFQQKIGLFIHWFDDLS